jgi:hypothetical protein
METAPNQQPIIQPNSNQPPYETRSVCDDNPFYGMETIEKSDSSVRFVQGSKSGNTRSNCSFIGRGAEAFSSLVGGAIGCVTFLAASEVLKLFINIEENTRRTANLLEKEETNKEEIKIEPPTTSPYQPPESKIQA